MGIWTMSPHSNTYLILEEHTVVLHGAGEVVDVAATLFIAGDGGTQLAAVAAGTGAPSLESRLNVHEGAIEGLIHLIRPQSNSSDEPRCLRSGSTTYQ